MAQKYQLAVDHLYILTLLKSDLACVRIHIRMHADPEAITGVHHVHMTAYMAAGQVVMALQAEQSWALVLWQIGEALLHSMGIPAGLVGRDIWANMWCCSCWA